MITPPVAIAAFTGAKLAGASPMATAVTACRLGWVAYVNHLTRTSEQEHTLFSVLEKHAVVRFDHGRRVIAANNGRYVVWAAKRSIDP